MPAVYACLTGLPGAIFAAMEQPDRAPQQLGTMSPFQDAPKPAEEPKKDFPVKSAIIVVYSLVVVLLLVLVVALLWRRTVEDPYRTLETFSAEKYFESAQS